MHCPICEKEKKEEDLEVVGRLTKYLSCKDCKNCIIDFDKKIYGSDKNNN